MNLVIATNNRDLADTIVKQGRYNVVATFYQKSELEKDLGNLFEEPDTLLVTEGFDCQGSTISDTLIGIKKEMPNLRIVYIQGEENTSGTKKIFSKMINNGIYDIGMGEDITLGAINNLLDNPRSYGEASKILEDDSSETYPNVFMVSSLKPGTGKTFLATNLAVAIAKYGSKRRIENTGKYVDPRILVVDGDLIGLGVTTMLRAVNYDKNMLTALNKIAKQVSPDGKYTMSEADIENMKRVVRGCLCRYKKLDNLYVMGTDSISLSELEKIAPVHFYFMMQMLVKAFDVIIVDSNSAFDHPTTAALYELSGHIFLLLDNDYNNIQNNLRYIGKLKEMGYDDKITFIVNKDLSREAELNCLENLDYDTYSIGDLTIEHRIPLIDAGIMKTIDYGEDLVITSNKAPEAKEKILEIADTIAKIDYNKVELDKEKIEEEQKRPNKIVKMLNN